VSQKTTAHEWKEAQRQHRIIVGKINERAPTPSDYSESEAENAASRQPRMEPRVQPREWPDLDQGLRVNRDLIHAFLGQLTNPRLVGP